MMIIERKSLIIWDEINPAFIKDHQNADGEQCVAASWFPSQGLW